MMRCVRDRTLWLIHEGQGSPAEGAHLRACPRCASRYDRLVRDLEALGPALRALPSVARSRPSARALAGRRLALAAALVVLVAVGSVEVWRWQVWSRPIPPASSARDVLPFLGEVSAVLWSAGSSVSAGGESAWLGEDAVLVLVSAGRDVDPLFLLDPLSDDDTDQDVEAESL